jgi:hypothetical protein
MDLAISGVSFQLDGGDVKKFSKVIETKPYAQGEMRGEVIKLWRKRMLPMVFKWSDIHKALLLNGLNESEVINSATGFLATELEVESVECSQAGESSPAFPLKPSVLYQ